MEIKALEIGYDSAAISPAQFEAHMKLYKGYVTKLAEIEGKLAVKPDREHANAVESHYRALKKGETYCTDSIILHEEYFRNMTTGTTKPREKTTHVLAAAFGSLEAFFADLKACGMAARGWCVTAYEQRSKTVRNVLCDTHDEGIIAGMYPLIVLDVYEHAYFIDYHTDKERYIEAFISCIDWSAVEKRTIKLSL